jgi:hypothetical protein
MTSCRPWMWYKPERGAFVCYYLVLQDSKRVTPAGIVTSALLLQHGFIADVRGSTVGLGQPFPLLIITRGTSSPEDKLVLS